MERYPRQPLTRKQDFLVKARGALVEAILDYPDPRDLPCDAAGDSSRLPGVRQILADRGVDPSLLSDDPVVADAILEDLATSAMSYAVEELEFRRIHEEAA